MSAGENWTEIRVSRGKRKNQIIINLRFHDLRHTAATYMVTDGIDLVTVAEILGHSDIKITMRYAHSTPEDKRKAVNVLATNFTTVINLDAEDLKFSRKKTKIFFQTHNTDSLLKNQQFPVKMGVVYYSNYLCCLYYALSGDTVGKIGHTGF